MLNFFFFFVLGPSWWWLIRFFVSTWNVGGIEPNEDLDMDDWIDPSCDIYVFG